MPGPGLPALSPLIGAQAGANDLAIGPGYATYPAANATVYRVYEYAVPVTTVASVPGAYPTTAGIPGIAAYPGAPGAAGKAIGAPGVAGAGFPGAGFPGAGFPGVGLPGAGFVAPGYGVTF